MKSIVNSLNVNDNGQQTAVIRGSPQIKFVDTTYPNVAIISTGQILSPSASAVTQGVGVSQRTGDTIFQKELFINYSLSAINNDVFSSARIIVFKWVPNSNLLLPIVTDILQTASLTSMYNWQLSNQYFILYDCFHSLAGNLTTPASSGNQAFLGKIAIKGPKRCEFAPATALSSNQIYVLVISDSSLTPFPIWNGVLRLTYSET